MNATKLARWLNEAAALLNEASTLKAHATQTIAESARKTEAVANENRRLAQLVETLRKNHAQADENVKQMVRDFSALEVQRDTMSRELARIKTHAAARKRKRND